MTKIIAFLALASRDVRAEFLHDPQPHSHAVQFYETDAYLAGTVGQFLKAGLRAGDALVVIATKAHCDDFLKHVESIDVPKAIAEGQLTMLDARETLAKFMIGDGPDT